MNIWVTLSISATSGAVGTLAGVAISTWSARRLRRSEIRFEGYVAIQRFLTSTHEQVDFEMRDYVVEGNNVRPVLDNVSPEAQAIANLVASKVVLHEVGKYITALSAFQSANGALSALTLQISTDSPTPDLVAKRTAALAKRRECQGELTRRFRSANQAMRKDLDLDEVDWSQIEKAQRDDTTPDSN